MAIKTISEHVRYVSQLPYVWYYVGLKNSFQQNHTKKQHEKSKHL